MPNWKSQIILETKSIFDSLETNGYTVSQHRGTLIARHNIDFKTTIVIRIGKINIYIQYPGMEWRICHIRSAVPECANGLRSLYNSRQSITGSRIPDIAPALPDSQWVDMLNDCDEVESIYPPEYGMDDVEAFLMAQGVEFSRGDFIFTISAHRDWHEECIEVLLRNNHWYLIFTHNDVFRFEDDRILDLVHEIFSIIEMGNGSAILALEQGYNARRINSLPYSSE